MSNSHCISDLSQSQISTEPLFNHLNSINESLQQYGLSFNLSAILSTFAHQSFIYENLTLIKSMGLQSESYQRREFFGDSVLDFIVSEKLYRENPHMNEGELSHLRSTIVNGENLSLVYDDLFEGPFILIGVGVLNQKKYNLKKIKADICEAFIAEVYLSAGIEKTKEILKESCLYNVEKKQVQINYKVILQNWLSKNNLNLKIETVFLEEENCFQARINLADQGEFEFKASTKKQAEIQLAKMITHQFIQGEAHAFNPSTPS